MKRQLLILLIPLFFLFGEEITIKGKTFNKIDGAPIAGVNIIIQGTDRGAASNLDGFFEINTPASLPLILDVTHIAYDRITIEVASDSFLTIGLMPTIIEGHEIEVMGARRKIEIDVASAVDRIDIEAIELQGARDIGSALRRVSSLQLNYANSGKQTISIRGSNATDVAVFLDGIRINDSNTGVADLSFIDLNSVEQIQVVKGGGTSLFGSDAIGGVVNIESRKAIKNSVYFIQGTGQTYSDDLDLSYGATGVYGPIGIGGRFTGKKRAFGGRTVTTSIFNNAFAGLNVFSGRFDLSWYSLQKSLQFESGGVTSDDGMDVMSAKYTGPIFGTKKWTFMAGQRDWNLNQNYFTSVNEKLNDGTITFQASKGFTIQELKNTIQIESENQSFNGDRSYFNVGGLPIEDHLADMQRTTNALAVVSRWAIVSDSPVVDHINWEFGYRLNKIQTIFEETTQNYTNGIKDEDSDSEYNEFSTTMTSKRLGVYVDGQTQKLRYSLFVNSGNNSRLPTLSDRFRFMHAVFDSSMDSILTREHLTATEVNLDITFMDIQTELPISETNLIMGVFINDYTNKIAYRPVEKGPPIPFNDLTADIRGLELAFKMVMIDGKFKLSAAGTWLDISNIRVFPNKPEYRYVATAELNLDWLSISYDHVNEGEQYYYISGYGDGVRKPRENSNFNIILQKKFWKVNFSASYTIRNIMSKDELDLTLEESIREGFNYFERYREIITFKISL